MLLNNYTYSKSKYLRKARDELNFLGLPNMFSIMDILPNASSITVWFYTFKFRQILRITMANKMEHGKNSLQNLEGLMPLFIICIRLLFVSDVRFWPHTYDKHFNSKRFLSFSAFLSFPFVCGAHPQLKMISSFKSRCCKSLKLSKHTQIFLHRPFKHTVYPANILIY